MLYYLWITLRPVSWSFLYSWSKVRVNFIGSSAAIWMYYVVLNDRCSTVSSTSGRNLWRTRFRLGYKSFLLPEGAPHRKHNFFNPHRNQDNTGVSSLVSMVTKVWVNYELNHNLQSKGKKGKLILSLCTSWRHYVDWTIITIIIIVINILLSVLCRVFTVTYRKQTMFLEYTVLRLFCGYTAWNMHCYFTCWKFCTFRSLCAVLNMAAFCSFLSSPLLVMLFRYFVDDFVVVSFAPAITSITFAFTFHICCISTVRCLYFRVFCLNHILPQEVVASTNIHVNFSLSLIMMSGLLLGMVLSVYTCWFRSNSYYYHPCYRLYAECLQLHTWNKACFLDM